MTSTLPPNTFGGAINLGTFGTVDPNTHLFRDYVVNDKFTTSASPFDTVYYRINVGQSGSALSLKHYELPGGSSWFELYDSKFQLIADNRSDNEDFGPALEYGNSDGNELKAGVYYLKMVRSNTAPSPAEYGFALSVFKQTVVDAAGETFAAARNLGVLSQARTSVTVSDNFYSLMKRTRTFDGNNISIDRPGTWSVEDRHDIFKIQVTSAGTLTFNISGETGNFTLYGNFGYLYTGWSGVVRDGVPIAVQPGVYYLQGFDRATQGMTGGINGNVGITFPWEVYDNYSVSVKFKPAVVTTQSYTGATYNEKFALHSRTTSIALSGGNGDDLLWSGTGNDVHSGGAGRDILIGGNGADFLYGDIAGNHVYGSPDQLLGGRGNDQAAGGGGNDYINGEWDNDTLSGGAGNDLIYGGLGADQIFGGDGNDQLWGASAGAANGGWFGPAIRLNRDGVTHAVISELWSIAGEAQWTDASADKLYGGAGNDIIRGNGGNDLLKGEAGSDTLMGDAGSDSLAGGLGVDNVYGGAGNDIFILDAPLSPLNRDVIRDFSNAVGNNDSFQLENAMMPKLGTAGALKPGFFFAGAAAHDPDDHLIYNRTTGNLFYDSNGNLAGGVVLLATIVSKPLLTAADFVVI